MKCPECEGKTWVTNSRPITDDEVHRSRKCRQCGFVFWTFEMIDLSRLPERITNKLEE